MLYRGYLQGLLWLTLVLVLMGAGYWWWSAQPGQLAPVQIETRTLELDTGLSVRLVSDPDTAVSEIHWRWAQGSRHAPAAMPGLHPLFADVLLYAETDTGYRHLRTRARRDPLARVSLRAGRDTTSVHYRMSHARFANELKYFAALITQPEYPLEGVAVERTHLLDPKNGLSYLADNEWEALTGKYPGLQPQAADAGFWSGMSDRAVARELARYGSDHLVPSRMTFELRAPLSLTELEALARGVLKDMPQGNPVALADTPGVDFLAAAQWFTLTASPVNTGDAQLAYRLLIPWAQQPGDLASAAPLLSWLNATYEQSPQRQLARAGALGHWSARAQDEGVVFDIYAAPGAQVEFATLYATLVRFLGQVTGSEVPAGFTIEADLADALKVPGLALALAQPTVFDHTANGTPAGWSQPEPEHALRLALPAESPVPSPPVAELEANAYELLGWQPQRLVNNERLQAWHYEDNRFGTQRVSAHVQLHWPIGPDQQVQARWERWARTRGPGWNQAALWAGQAGRSRADGLSVSADANGLVWHFTANPAVVSHWLQSFTAELAEHPVRLKPSPVRVPAGVQLMRERAAFETTPPPESLAGLPATLLLMGRLDTEAATELIDHWRAAQPAEPVTLPDVQLSPWQLDRALRVAELDVPGDRSAYTRVTQVPENTLRHQTLAAWSLPWIDEVLNRWVRAEGFVGDMKTRLAAPLGYTQLGLELTSRDQDPARLGLYAREFMSRLNTAVGQADADAFRASTRDRAALLREPARSLVELATYHWQDIQAGRRHFNGRELQAGILEGTSIDGWRFFANEWLFGNSARRLSVFEIGEPWRDAYRQARDLPPGARVW